MTTPNDYVAKAVRQHPKMSKNVDFGCWCTCLGVVGN